MSAERGLFDFSRTEATTVLLIMFVSIFSFNFIIIIFHFDYYFYFYFFSVIAQGILLPLFWPSGPTRRWSTNILGLIMTLWILENTENKRKRRRKDNRQMGVLVLRVCFYSLFFLFQEEVVFWLLSSWGAKKKRRKWLYRSFSFPRRVFPWQYVSKLGSTWYQCPRGLTPSFFPPFPQHLTNHLLLPGNETSPTKWSTAPSPNNWRSNLYSFFPSFSDGLIDLFIDILFLFWPFRHEAVYGKLSRVQPNKGECGQTRYLVEWFAWCR